MNLIKYMLGLLLHYANRGVPTLTRSKFYELKTLILKKHGKFIRQEIQHIKEECWSCDGTGVFKSSWKLPEPCWNCYDGVYKEFWTRLDKYKISKWEFHIPIERMIGYSPLNEGESLPMIEGYINHKTPKYHLNRECCLWLYLFFDIKSFWKEFVSLGCTSHKRTPLVFLSTLAFRLKHFNWKSMIKFRHRQVKHNTVLYDNLPF